MISAKNQYYPGISKYYNYKVKNNTLYGGEVGGANWTYYWSEGKVSVDTGTFVPGVYRVNPYQVVSTRLIDPSFLEAKEVAVSPAFTYIGEKVYQIATGEGPWILGWLLDKAKTSVPVPSMTSYQQLALQKAYSKVGASDFSFGEDLGEYRETVKMLRAPLSALKKFFVDNNGSNLRLLIAFSRPKYDYKEICFIGKHVGKASIEAATGIWLEFRYGLRPLIGTLENVIDLVDGKKRQILDPDKIRSCRTKLDFDFVSNKSYSAFQRQLASRADIRVRDQISASASVQYRQRTSQGDLDRLGLTPRFLPETAWQLTRCSFVADWLFTIGPWLQSLRINPGIEVLGNTTGVRHTRSYSINSPEVSNYGFANWTSMKSISDGEIIRLDTYTRECNVKLSYLPHFTWGRTLDLFKAVDALSLIWQFMPKRWRR